MKKQNKKSETFNVFRCDQCPQADEMDLPKFKEHLLSVHGIDSKNLKGTKQMIMHMDMTDSYSSTYKWTLESGLTFHQFCQNVRAKDDPMRYS